MTVIGSPSRRPTGRFAAGWCWCCISTSPTGRPGHQEIHPMPPSKNDRSSRPSTKKLKTPVPTTEPPPQEKPQRPEPTDDRHVRVQALAAVTLKLVEVMRQVFPVKGRAWPKAGEDEREALQPFLALIPRFARCWWIPTSIGWKSVEATAEDPPALGNLVPLWETVFRHYEWGRMGVTPHGKLDRRPGRPTWSWPGVPAIPEDLLNALETSARSLATPKSDGVVPRRPCYDRDHIWLGWADAGMTPAKIRDKWNKEHPQETVGSGEPGRDTVRKGLKRACDEKKSD
jgi:hypothetical protein